MNYLRQCVTAVCLNAAIVSTASASCGSAACSINTNWDEHSVTRPGLSMDLRESYTRADQLRSGSSRIAADTAFAGEVENLRTITRITTLGADYTADEHWGIMTTIPYVNRDHAHHLGPYAGTLPAGYESFHAESLGDIRVVGRYRWTLDEQERSGAGIKLGLKLNTGRRDFTLNTGVIPTEAMLQPGNGSTDLIVGAFWSQATPGESWSWFAQGTLEGSVRHAEDYRPGNQANLDIGGRYAFGSKMSGLLQANAQWNEADSGANAALSPVTGGPSSGGKIVSLTPGLMYSVIAGTNLYALVQVPLYQYVNGEQLTASRSLTVGINHRL